MDRKKILFAIGAAAIMVLAATVVPTVNMNESDVDEYIVNTIDVKENTFTSYLQSLSSDVDNHSSYSDDTKYYDINPKDVGYDQLEVDTNISFSVNDGNVTYSGETEELMSPVLSYEPVFNGDEISDIIVTFDNGTVSLKDLYDPVDNCVCVEVVTVYGLSQILGCIPFFGWIVLGVITVVVAVYCLISFMDENGNKISVDSYEDVVDGIRIGKNSNNDIIAVEILGIGFSLNDTYKMNDSNAKEEKNNYHFALVCGAVYLFPPIISKSTAEKIIELPQKTNRGGVYSVYTFYHENAYSICMKHGEPVGPEIHGANNQYIGYFYHYHTCNHITPAHSFFYWWY